MITVNRSTGCEGWIYDPNGSGTQTLGIRSGIHFRDPCPCLVATTSQRNPFGVTGKADIFGVGSAYLVRRSSIWPPAGRACAARTGRWTARTWPWCACAERRSRERAPSARNSRWSVDGQRTPHINTRGGRSADQVRYPATPLLADSLNGSGIPKAVFHEQKRCAIEVADAKKIKSASAADVPSKLQLFVRFVRQR